MRLISSISSGWRRAAANGSVLVSSERVLMCPGSVCPCRWLTYLLLLIVDLIICLLACLGLAKQSRWLLTT